MSTNTRSTKKASAEHRARADITSDITHDLREEMTRVGQAIFQSIKIAEDRGAQTLREAARELDRAAQERAETAKATAQANKPSPLAIYVAAALAFVAGASFAWLVTPTQHIRQIYTYRYQISRAGAPRLAIDPGAAFGTGIKPLPKLLPLPTKKGGRQ